MKKLIRVSINETGGEFTCGTIESDQAKTIEDKHSIFSESCEGKGEWENDFLKIVDSSEETLYEDGDY